jgi:hypothetical protein
VPREGNTGGCAPKGGQQPVSQVMRQAQQVIYGGQTGQLLVFQRTLLITLHLSESYRTNTSVVDPDSHQSDKLDPDPHQFADAKPKCIKYVPSSYYTSKISK